MIDELGEENHFSVRHRLSRAVAPAAAPPNGSPPAPPGAPPPDDSSEELSPQKAEKLFEEFLLEKRLLRNVSEHTIGFYKGGWRSFKRFCGAFTKQGMKRFLLNMRQTELRPASVNNYIDSVNIFVNWLFENGHITQRLTLPKIREGKSLVKILAEDMLRVLVNYQPTTLCDRRLHTLICLIIDTGIRIDEALTLKREMVDLKNCLILVKGKGNKERIVPLSPGSRQKLLAVMKDHPFQLVFCTDKGNKLMPRNVRRDFVLLAKKLGVADGRVGFHQLRHTFATRYLRGGGPALILKEQLGHAHLSTTLKYCHLTYDDLRRVHGAVSPLESLMEK